MGRAALPLPTALAMALLLALLALGASAAERPRPREIPPPGPASLAPSVAPSPPSSQGLPDGAACFGSSDPAAGPSLPVPGPFDPDPSALPSGGADGSPAITPRPTTTPGSGGSEDETARHRLAVPAIRLDLPADWIGMGVDDIEDLDELPNVTATLSGIEEGTLAFLGADILPGEGCEVGGTVSVFDAGAAVSERVLALTAAAFAAAIEELEEVPGEVKLTTVELPVGTAQRMTFRFDATEDGALTTWWVRADLFSAAGRNVLGVYAAPEAMADEAKATFTAIARSIRER